ncbi:MAG: AAA family ATPase [Anaerolineales bacterium]
MMMKFPYGIADFYKVITQDYFYTDRTDRIPLLEAAGEQLLFLRPRRFGKSLLLSMLENYYDVARADEFERLFGHLAIGQNPTPLHNQYLVMRWDFSEIDPSGGAQEIKQALHRNLNVHIRAFTLYYRTLLPADIYIDPVDGLTSFQSLVSVVRATPYRLYLLIDEYDNFANEVLMSTQPGRRADYESLVTGDGLLKTVFKVIKSAATGRGLDRVFITGVSPVVLSDATSGYNVAKNIYLRPKFNDLCGFWEAEIETALRQMVQECNWPASKAVEALAVMRMFYNGYVFHQDAPDRLYNPTLALYFLDYLQDECQYPPNMLDSNFATDRNKIAYVAQLVGGAHLILDALQDHTPLHLPKLEDRFGLREILRGTQTDPFMASLLYYLGVLTLGKPTKRGELTLHIPNLVSRKLYAERIRNSLLPNRRDHDTGRRAAQALYQTGEMQPLCDFIEQYYFKVFDNRDYQWTNEITIKTAFLTLLFEDTFYIMESEATLERRYTDLLMLIRPEMRKYELLDILIEFKYLQLKALALDQTQVRALSAAELAALPLVAEKLAEARAQAHTYHQRLEAKYGNILRLRGYAVVAVGFERLVWEAL